MIPASVLPQRVRLTVYDGDPIHEKPENLRTPPNQLIFFSQNVGSLGQSMLGRLDSASMVHDPGAVVTQKLVYKLKP